MLVRNRLPHRLQVELQHRYQSKATAQHRIKLIEAVRQGDGLHAGYWASP